jgi:putative ABC transport system permease protein
MGVVAATALSDLRRRRLQTAVLAVVLGLASAAATFALVILVGSHQPFERAFAAANGAHLVIDYRGVESARLAGTRTADGVLVSAGPWPVAEAAIRHPNGGWIEGQAISGRPQPEAAIDAVTLSAGRWWQRPGEAVIGRESAESLELQLGDQISIAPAAAGPADGLGPGPGSRGPIDLPGDKPGEPADRDPVATLTVVGIARSVSTPDTFAWMSPTDVVAASPAAVPGQQMLYRVEPAGTAEQLAAATARITSGLPADAVANSGTYLETRTDVNDTADLYVPVLLAFSVFALAAAAFTIANVVSGIVLTSYRDIGVMKAVGFTPRQVSGVLLGQILLPVALGTAIGTALGAVGSLPTVERLARSFGLPGAAEVSMPVVVGVPAIAVAVAFVAALGPALRAGRLSVAGAIGGRATSARRGDARPRPIDSRLPIGVPAGLGIAAAFGHPLRATMTLGPVLVGVAALTFALGVDLTLLRVVPQLDRTAASPVRAHLVDPTLDPAAVSAAIAELPGTDRSVAIGEIAVAVRALGTLPFVGYDGDAGWIGYELIRGRWIAGPGEVVAPTNLYRQTGLRIGDTLELAGTDGSTVVRLVGETFEATGEAPDNLVLRGTWADAMAVDPSARLDRWEIRPAEGVPAHGLATAVRSATEGAVETFTLEDTSTDEEFLLFLSVVATMGVVLVAISLGGVFNTVLLETRQRTHELAVLKTIGLSPRQVVVVVISGVVPIGLAAGLLGLPLGLAFQRRVISYMGEVAGQTGVPESAFDVFGPVMFAALALSGLAIAAIGAWLPAQRAAATRIAPILQSE